MFLQKKKFFFFFTKRWNEEAAAEVKCQVMGYILLWEGYGAALLVPKGESKDEKKLP